MTVTSNKPKKFSSEDGGNSVVTLISSILQEIAEFKGWELIFQGLLYAFLGWAIYNLKILHDFHTSPEWAHIEKYSIYDFKLALVMIAVFLGYKTACKAIFFNMIKSRLDPLKFPTEEDKNTRAKVSCNWVGNVIYYTCSTITAFLLFRDQDFFPKELGGTAEPVMMYEGLPYTKKYPYLVVFYMVQFGRHVHTLIDYCVYKWNTPKFWEMFLHHCMAVFLIFFSYLMNGVRVGVLVLFVHDPTDVFLCFGRMLADFKVQSKVLKYANFIMLVITWVFFRLWAFPKCIVGTAITYYFEHDVGRITSPMVFMMFMLMALVILHSYWFVFILRIMVTMLRGKSNYNLYDKSAKKNEDETATPTTTTSTKS